MPKIEDQRRDAATLASTETLKIGSLSCPHSTPEEISPTFAKTTHTQTCARVRRYTRTTLPAACNLHLGKGIFHLSVTATGQTYITAYRLTLRSTPPPATLPSPSVWTTVSLHSHMHKHKHWPGSAAKKKV